jgi:hypothetical protein
MGDMRVDHQQAAAANACGMACFECPMDRHIFADDVSVADLDNAWVLRHVNVLRHPAQHGTLHDGVVPT